MRSLANNVNDDANALRVELTLGEEDTRAMAVHADPQLNDFAVRETPVVEHEEVGSTLTVGNIRIRSTDQGGSIDTKEGGEWSEVVAYP